jgi:DNA-binding NarL/FixJ family response regulator
MLTELPVSISGQTKDNSVSAPTRVVLADDHPIVLNALRNLVTAEDDFELVAEASSGPEALKIIRDKKPDVAIVDISMPELNGIALSRRVIQENPCIKVLILTLHEDRAYLRQAIDAGVQGYLLKRSATENLVPAVRSVVTGGLYVDPAIANRMFDSMPSRRRGLLGARMQALTERECEVLKLVALGYTNKEIARQLDVGVKSVETYKARANEKLDLKTRAELVRYAAVQGWFSDI